MKRGERTMKSWYVVLTLVLVVVLTGCNRGQATSANTGSSESYTSAYLGTSYSNALPVNSQLALGTLQLEGTEHAVTPEQAKTLLPLWQALQGGVTAQTEINAVMKQIEGTMTQEQLTAIAAMQLTQEDLQTWMEEQGLQMPGGPGEGGGQQGLPPEATRQPGGFGPPGDLSQEEQEAMRATAEAGGLGPRGDLSQEEQEAMRATAEAGGMPARAGGRANAGSGQLIILLNPLIELLETRAGE
jgi:hypothetical protein